MQISPSTSLLQALSRPADPATAPRPNAGNEAARAAARAIFSQIQAPAAARAPAVQGQGFSVPQQASTPQQTAPLQLPATPPTKPMPRGSLLNILV